MTLAAKRCRFTKMIGQLIGWAFANGYELSIGEAYRTPEQAKANAIRGAGIANSLHIQGLAVDFNLFINGQYQRDTAAYARLGEYWESIGGTWGGRFKRADGNHFSLEHDGVR